MIEEKGRLDWLFGLWLFTLAVGYSTSSIVGVRLPEMVNAVLMGWFPLWLLLTSQLDFIRDGLLFGAFRPRWMPALFIAALLVSALLSIELVFALLNTAMLWVSLGVIAFMWRTPRLVLQALRIQALLLLGYLAVLFLAHLATGESPYRGLRLSLGYNAVVLALLTFQALLGALLMTAAWKRWLLTGIVFLVVLFSGTRHMLAAALLSILLFIILQGMAQRGRLNPQARRAILTGSVGTVLLAAALMASPMGGYGLAELPGAIGRSGASLLERFKLWANTLAIWREYPLFGVGPGQQQLILLGKIPFSGALPFAEEKNWHAHNAFITMLADFGLAGFLAWLLLMFRGVQVMLRHWWRERSTELAAILAFIGGMSIPLMMEGLAFVGGGHVLWLLLLLFALMPQQPPPPTAARRGAPS